MLPLHAEVYPGLRFVHLIRDGRDMALAGPHGLLRRERSFLRLDPDDLITAQLQLWTMTHNRAADDAARLCAPGHYLEIRYEDLCARPAEAVRRLFAFVGAPEELADGAAGHVRPSPGIGRWRSQADAINARADASFWEAMARFGYGGDR